MRVLSIFVISTLFGIISMFGQTVVIDKDSHPVSETIPVINVSYENTDTTCESPTMITVERLINFVDNLVTWTPPEGAAINEWIHWDDGANFNSIGTGDSVEFEVAARWNPSQLSGYDGATITEVAFFPDEADAVYRIRVWSGNQGGSPESMLIDQLVDSPEIGEWNTITLDSLVLVNASEDLWVGYYVNTSGGYPAGADGGPAVGGYGNMMNFNGWQTLLEINPELDYNWNIQAHLLYDPVRKGTPIPMRPLSYSSTETLQAAAGTGKRFQNNSGSRTIQGYNIYRTEIMGEYSFLDYKDDDGINEYLDQGLPTDKYYCYKMTTVCSDDSGTWESDLSYEGCEAIIIGTLDEDRKNQLEIYPNPSTDWLTVDCLNDIESITVYNLTGQEMKSVQPASRKYQFRTAGIPDGIYFFRVETREKTFFRKIAVAR